jgi:hypothetical protein
MTVTCTPDVTTVEFSESCAEARDIAELNVHPTTSVYVGPIALQGEHRTRGSSKHIAIMVDVDPELRRALTVRAGSHGGKPRLAIVGLLQALMRESLDQIRKDYRATQHDPGGPACVRCGRTTHTMQQLVACSRPPERHFANEVLGEFVEPCGAVDGQSTCTRAKGHENAAGAKLALRHSDGNRTWR